MSRKNTTRIAAPKAIARLFTLLVLGLFGGYAFAALDVSMSKEDGYPNPIYPGDVTALHITLQNSNNIAAVTGTLFTNNMPAALQVAGSGLISYACTDGNGAPAATTGVVTATPGSSVIDLAGGTLPMAATSSGRCDIVVEVTSIVQGATHTNSIGVGQVMGNDGLPVSNGTPAVQTITVLTLNSPGISKNFNKSTVIKDDETVRLTITIDNSANSSRDLPLNTAADTPAYGLQDVLPAGLQVAAVPNASVSCSSGGSTATFGPSASDTTLNVIGGSIPAGASCNFAVDLVGTSTGGNYSLGLTNTINGTTQFHNKRGLNAAGNASDSLTVASALQVDTRFNPTTVRQGEQGSLTVTLRNASPTTTLTGVTLTQNSINSSGSGTGSLAINSLSTNPACGAANVVAVNANQGFAFGNITPGSISPGASCVVTIAYTGTLGAAGTPETFTHSIAEGVVSNTQAAVSEPASHSVTVIDELVVSKTRSPSTVAPGNPVRYTVTVRNYASGALSGVRITDPLPAGMLALQTPAPSMSGSGCAGVLVHDIAGPAPSTATPHLTFDMNAGAGPNPARCDVTFWAMTPVGSAVGTVYSNQIPVNGVCDGNGGGGVCNAGASSASSARVSLADVVTLSKSFSPNSASEGTVSELTVVLTNLSAQPMSSGSLTDNLPLGSTGLQLQVADPPIASSTCAGASITANPGDPAVSVTGATIPARASGGLGAFGTCTVKVNVIGPAGNYTNVLPAGALNATQTFADGNTQAVASPGPVQATLSYSSALNASKSFSPSTIQSGGSSTVAVRLSNLGTGTLNNVSVVDPLPAGMLVANPANAYTTCGGTTSVMASPGAATASLSGAVVPAAGQCEFLFDVTATGGGNWTNAIPAGNVTATGGVQNVNPVSAVLNNSSAGAVTVTNNIGPNSLSAPGETAVLTIDLVNNGTVDLTGLNLTDYFTADGTSGGSLTGMQVAATPAVSTSCTGGVATANPGGTSVSISGASLIAGANCAVSVNVSMTQIGTIQDLIPVGAVGTDQGVSNTLSTTTSLSTQASIGVTKQFLSPVVKPGERSRVRITFINPLSQPLANLSATDTLPAGLTVPAGANPTTSCTGATVTAPTPATIMVANGNLPAAFGATAPSCVAEIDVVAAAAGTYTNVIVVNAVSASAGGTPTSNLSPATAVLAVREPLGIAKSFAPNSVSPGVPATLIITLSNANSVALTGAAFTDNLPSNLAVALTPNASTSCAGGVVTAAASATSVGLAGATIPAGGSCQIQVDTLSNTPGVYTNTIPAGSVSTLEGISNEDPTSADLRVSDLPTVSKQFSPPTIASGGTSTLTIVIGNTNPVALTTTANFNDLLPAAPGAVLVATPASASTTCGGALVAAAGSSSVRLNSGAGIPAGGCTITVDVTGVTVGTHINSIPAGALQTDLGSNLQAANTSLEISALGYISGRVFADNNLVPIGTFESGTDTPIPGITINLRNAAEAIVATTTTDALGNYVFTGLAAGTYSVEEPAQPPGTVNGTTTAGSLIGAGGGSVGTPSNTATTPSRINTIALGGGVQIDGSPDNNFAELVPSSISGSVFLDQNNNGVENGADSALAGVTIELLDNGGGLLASATTDANGDYRFSGLLPGIYSVRQPNQPAGTSNGITTSGAIANGGTAGSASAVGTLPSAISTIVLPPNTAAGGNNFAEIPNSRRVSGNVFLDFDNNGAINGPDHGIDAVAINLTGTDINGNPVSLSTSTAADGSFSFTGLAAGTYTLDETGQPNGSSNGTTTAGSTGGIASNPTASSSRIANLDLTAANTVSGGNLFGEIPGASPDLSISKTHTPASFAEGSTTGFYTITTGNIGAVATTGTITVADTLPAGMSVVSMPVSGTWTCTSTGQLVTCSSNTVINAGGSGTPIILRVAVASGLAGQLLTNTAAVSGGGESSGLAGNNTATDPTAISQAASVQGTVWRDDDHDRVLDPGEPLVAGWVVELLQGGLVVATAVTDGSGAYNFSGVAPGGGYQIRFRDPDSNAIWGKPVPNESGTAFADGVTSAANPAGADTSTGILQNLTLLAGTNTVEQSLPLDPSGVVYDSITRQPVSGAVVGISGPPGFSPAAHLVGGAANANQTTGVNGFYQFLLLPGAPAGTYTLGVTEPSGYLPGGSAIIPVCGNSLTVAGVPDPALVHSSNSAPASGAPQHDPASCPASSAGLAASAASTQYYLRFVLTPGVSADLVNNHIPLDLITSGAFSVLKTTPLVNVSRGDLVPYSISVTNNLAGTIPNIEVRDQIPPGFKYRSGSASMDGIVRAPVINGRLLTWPNLTFAAGQQRVFKLMLVVGSGVSEGEYVNQAWANNSLANVQVSNLSTATVRVTPDPTFDCSDLIGKVFDDRNANGYQDQVEPGIANVRVVTVRGLLVTTDEHGRFHVACADIPNEWRGSNFIMKLDERTLPSGYRMTTENPRVVRLTRGKLSKLNFGASIHRVVRLDLSAAAFVEQGEVLLPVWQEGLTQLITTLRKAPSVLRLAYQGSAGEPPDLARSRLEHVRQSIDALWQEQACCYPLQIETEMTAGGADK